MSLYSDWRNDKPTQRIAIATLIATFAVPFLASAAADLPRLTNLLIGVAILVLGAIIALWRLRRSAFRGLLPKTDAPREHELGHVQDSSQVRQPESTVVKEDQPGRRWEVATDSIRKAPIVNGEGPILLMGYAQVDAVGDEGNNKLYYCKMYDVREAHAYFEFRVNAPWGRLPKRQSQMRLLPGEIVVSERTWSSEDGEDANNIVADSKSISNESRDLFKGSESMVVVWTDTISHGNDNIETKTHRLVVSLDGFLEVEEKIGDLRRQARLRHSPF